MVFMEDSERAAETAGEKRIDVGLHLNFTTLFSAKTASRLAEHQRRTARFLTRGRYTQVVFHPGLAKSFDYVAKAQYEEFERLYGTAAKRIDGHHHMHLCSNVLFARLLPEKTIVRRNFSFRPGEKGAFNRFYRDATDRLLARRHSLTDLFFSIQPLESPDHLSRIFSAARKEVVEVEVHPVMEAEYRFLTGGGIFERVGDLQIERRYAVKGRTFESSQVGSF